MLMKYTKSHQIALNRWNNSMRVDGIAMKLLKKIKEDQVITT